MDDSAAIRMIPEKSECSNPEEKSNSDKNPQELNESRSQEEELDERLNEAHFQTIQPSMESFRSKDKLVSHQKDRYMMKAMKKGMFAQEEEDDQIESQNSGIRRDFNSSSSELKPMKDSSIRKGRNAMVLPPLEAASSTKFLSQDEFSKFSKSNATLTSTIEKLKFKTKYKPEEVVDFSYFVREHIPKNKVFSGLVKRNRDGTKRFFPLFDLYFYQGLKYVMSSKRQTCFSTSTFHMVYTKEILDSNSQSFSGMIKSNFLGTFYNIYSSANEQQENLLATIHYVSEVTCKAKPRQIEVYLLSPYYKFSQLSGIEKDKNLMDLYNVEENFENKRILKLVNKKPIWNEKRETWQLNFSKKAKISSVKNMIMVDAETEERECLLLAKTEDSTYHIDINHPLSPRIAMGIVNSSFDFKWVSQ